MAIEKLMTAIIKASAQISGSRWIRGRCGCGTPKGMVLTMSILYRGWRSRRYEANEPNIIWNIRHFSVSQGKALPVVRSLVLAVREKLQICQQSRQHSFYRLMNCATNIGRNHMQLPVFPSRDHHRRTRSHRIWYSPVWFDSKKKPICLLDNITERKSRHSVASCHHKRVGVQCIAVVNEDHVWCGGSSKDGEPKMHMKDFTTVYRLRTDYELW